MSSMQGGGGGGGGHSMDHHIRQSADEDEDYGVEEGAEEEAWEYTDADATGEVVQPPEVEQGNNGDVSGGQHQDSANLWNNAVNDVVDGAMSSSPWEQYEDEEGNWYWYNHDTGASQWDTPEGEGAYEEEGYEEGDYDENYDYN